MPSSIHEALIEIFRHRPALAADLLSNQCGIDLPQYRGVRLDSGDLTDLIPTEYRADAVVVLTNGNTPAAAVVVEVQLGQDRRKRWSWPVYLTTLRARLRCPTVLLVICTNPRIASWCASGIPLGHPGLVLAPMVLGPDQVPVVTDPGEAQHRPELAVLSAMTHVANPDWNKIFDALLSALDTLDSERATLYHDVVYAALPAATKRYLETLMSSGLREYQAPYIRQWVFQGRAEGKVEGKAEGKAESVLAVLTARGIDVPADARTRVTTCADPAQLDVWLRRAVTVDTVAALFD